MTHLSDTDRSDPITFKSRLWLLVAIIAAALIAAALYWPTLHLPLLYDDLLHIRISKGLDFLSVWLPTESFGFFRPLAFLPFLIIKRIFGYYPPGLLHGLNVLQHVANVILVVWLSWRLWHKLRWAAASGLLLALFPFAFRAVAIFANNVHVATPTLLLLALHTYLSAIRSKSRAPGWWLLTAVLFFLGLMSSETAVLFGAFAALVEWNDQGQLPKFDFQNIGRSLRNIIVRPWFIFLLFGALYTIGYRLFDFSRYPQPALTSSDLTFKFLYVAQVAAYPFTWFSVLLPEDPTVSVVVVLSALALALILTFWSAREPANRLPLLLGWVWWGLASLLITIGLETNYLLHGPRLLYMSSVGLVFLWPILFEPIYQLPRIGRLLWAGLLLFVLVTNWVFVRSRLEVYELLSEPVETVEAEMDGRPPEEGILMVNLPNWMDPGRNTYPIGVEFVPVMGDYLFTEELMGENLRVDRPVQAIKVPDLLTNQDYSYGIHEQAAGEFVEGDWAPEGSHIFVVSFGEEGPETKYTGQLTSQSVETQPLATLGPYDLLDADAAFCDGTVELVTVWRPGLAADISPTTSLFVQLLSDDGQLIAQADGPPVGLRPDLIEMPSEWLIVDRRELVGDGRQPAEILIGAYDFVRGDRYPAVDERQNPLPDGALHLAVSDCN